MYTFQCFLLASVLALLSAQCQNPQPPRLPAPAPLCKDAPYTCAADSNGNPTFCMNMFLQLSNGQSGEKSGCVPGECASDCKDQQGFTCDSSTCTNNLCSCSMTQSAATTFLTGVGQRKIQVAGNGLSGATGLLIGLAAPVPHLIPSLTGGLSLDSLLGIVGSLPIVGKLLKNLGILDLVGNLLGTVTGLLGGGGSGGLLGGLLGGSGGGLLGGLLGGSGERGVAGGSGGEEVVQTTSGGGGGLLGGLLGGSGGEEVVKSTSGGGGGLLGGLLGGGGGGGGLLGGILK